VQDGRQVAVLLRGLDGRAAPVALAQRGIELRHVDLEVLRVPLRNAEEDRDFAFVHMGQRRHVGREVRAVVGGEAPEFFHADVRRQQDGTDHAVVAAVDLDAFVEGVVRHVGGPGGVAHDEYLRRIAAVAGGVAPRPLHRRGEVLAGFRPFMQRCQPVFDVDQHVAVAREELADVVVLERARCVHRAADETAAVHEHHHRHRTGRQVARREHVDELPWVAAVRQLGELDHPRHVDGLARLVDRGDGGLADPAHLAHVGHHVRRHQVGCAG
jgi:hypothetical protein